MKHEVEKPVVRGTLRRFLGREYFILKRRVKWWIGKEKFANVREDAQYNYSVVRHKSFLLRPLKDVEMYLQHNKVTNLKIAISHLNQVVIKPGETFSIWRLVGRPARRKGYLEGMTLHNGKIMKDTGGGLCQLGNLLYWMALHSPLTVSERWRHGYDVFPDINRTIPFACGATLSYNYVDLQLRNETKDTFQINLWVDEEYLNGELLCNELPKYKYEVVETDHFFKLQWWGGYTRHNRIWKRSTELTSGLVTETLIAENSAIIMYNPLLEGSGTKTVRNA